VKINCCVRWAGSRRVRSATDTPVPDEKRQTEQPLKRAADACFVLHDLQARSLFRVTVYVYGMQVRTVRRFQVRGGDVRFSGVVFSRGYEG
jgi:hypothetical protein